MPPIQWKYIQQWDVEIKNVLYISVLATLLDAPTGDGNKNIWNYDISINRTK